MKICAIQLPKNSSKETIENYFLKASQKKADIICFPELFVEGNVSSFKKWFSSLAKKYSLYAIMGSVFYNNKNRSYFFDSKGKTLGYYDKIHLNGNERQKTLPGRRVKTFSTPLGKIGIIICRDILYPETVKKIDCDILFCPGYWCSYSKEYPKSYTKIVPKNPKEVDVLVPARAFENSCAVVFVNACGKNAKETLLGKTQVALPFFGTTKKLSSKESMLVTEIDLSLIRKAKKAYGF